jgi:outer membrane protein TolC
LAVLQAQAAPAPPPEDTRKPLSLETLVRDSLTQNLTLTAARASTKSTATAVTAAQSAFDPLLNLSPSWDWSNQSILLPTSNEPGAPTAASPGTGTTDLYQATASGLTPISTSYSVGFTGDVATQTNQAILAAGVQSPSATSNLTFTVTQPLLRGIGPTYAQAPVKIAQYTADAAWATLDETTQQTIANVETAYWTLGLAEAVERLSRASYERSKELLGRNEKLLELKLLSEYDIITSRRGVEQRLATLTSSVRSRQDAAESLLFLVYGRKAPDMLAQRDAVRTELPNTDVPPPPPMPEIEKEALENRRDYLAAHLDVLGSQLQTRLNKNALLPGLNVSGAYNVSTTGVSNIRLSGLERVGDIAGHDWKVGVNFTYPILNRAARAAYDKARFDTENFTENLASTENLVRGQVRTAARGISADLETLKSAQASFDYSKKEYEGGLKQLQLGLIDSFRLLQIDDDVSSAEQVLEQTRYDLAQQITNYNLALGTIGRRYQVQNVGITSPVPH